MAGVEKRAHSVRKSCAASEIAFRGLMRQIACAGALSRVRCCEIVAGAENPWISECELGFLERSSRLRSDALCRGTQWQAVRMGLKRVACVACVALCHEDCVVGVLRGVAVLWGLLGWCLLSPCLGDY